MLLVSGLLCRALLSVQRLPRFLHEASGRGILDQRRSTAAFPFAAAGPWGVQGLGSVIKSQTKSVEASFRVYGGVGEYIPKGSALTWEFEITKGALRPE